MCWHVKCLITITSDWLVLSNIERFTFHMSQTRIKTDDKIKALNQMLEDLADEEFGEYSEVGIESYSSLGGEVRHFTSIDDFIALDNKY